MLSYEQAKSTRKPHFWLVCVEGLGFSILNYTGGRLLRNASIPCMHCISHAVSS